MFSNLDKFSSIFLMALSGFLWWSLGDVPTDVAYYPKVIVFCIFAFSLVLLFQALVSSISHKTLAPVSSAFIFRRPAIELVGISAIYLIVLPYLGFIASSMIFMVFLMWRLGVRQWLSIAGVTIGTILLVYLGFEKGLMVPLPDGYAVWSLFY